MDTQLRKKILYTLFIIILFRLGSNIFVPFLNNDAIQTMTSGASLLNYLDVMTGGSLGKGTLLAMSITPYINASIIIQLLAVAIPPLLLSQFFRLFPSTSCSETAQQSITSMSQF